ncbi:IS3 family transposase, partial [Vibrio cholerae]|uniref:IS3 family transposase n=1 Tax=Vibrio cholerae TaxID=666 RepID=UPI003A0FEBF7
VTDVTEFKLKGKKLYLSPVLDLYNSEVIARNMETHPNMNLITKMLDDALDAIDEYIHYYNHERIKVKLNGLSPVEFRTQTMIAAY